MKQSTMEWREAPSAPLQLPTYVVPVRVRVVGRGVATVGCSLHAEEGPESCVVGYVTGCLPPCSAPRRTEVVAACDAGALMRALHLQGGEAVRWWVRRNGRTARSVQVMINSR